ncbi:MAG TPA: hypothetical protein H9989_00045, partial [Candidatus Lawsonibacter pullicola]|nr:hypothetical protein [Candidatus Lawsonibacter pullicola]
NLTQICPLLFLAAFGRKAEPWGNLCGKLGGKCGKPKTCSTALDRIEHLLYFKYEHTFEF